MKNLLIITDLSFPTGSAMASRILSFCRLYNEIGYKVHVITTKTTNKEIEYEKTYFENFYSYEVVNSNRSYRLQTYFGNENLKKVVVEYLENNSVDLVFTTSLNVNFKKIYDVCKKLNKKIILEQCEWYDSSSFTFGIFDPRYIIFNINIRHNYICVDGVIAISNYLYDYYKNKNVKVIRIPSIFSIEEESKHIKNSKIKLIYTGNPSKSKDLLRPVIDAYVSNKKFINNIDFDIYGADAKAVLKNTGYQNIDLDKLNNIHINGMISDKEYNDMLNKADFQIFIKPTRRSSDACFPTKLAEAMAHSIPVISNNTGDICLYLKDNKNGFVSANSDVESIVSIFDKLIEIKDKEYNELRKNARKTAEESFDYRLYKNLVKDFIKTL